MQCFLQKNNSGSFELYVFLLTYYLQKCHNPGRFIFRNMCISIGYISRGEISMSKSIISTKHFIKDCQHATSLWCWANAARQDVLVIDLQQELSALTDHYHFQLGHCPPFNPRIHTFFYQKCAILLPAAMIKQEEERCEISLQIVLGYHHLSEKVMAPHSNTLAWKILWTEEPGRLQSMGSLRVGHD